MRSLTAFFLFLFFSIPLVNHASDNPPGLRVILIRHAEKPEKGKNLSCAGRNRAAALAGVLHQKFGKPDYTYVPAMHNGKKAAHLRMFQTITPFAQQYNLNINNAFDEADYQGLTADILRRKGTVLVVWEHSGLNDIAKALGVVHPGKWPGADYDSIWIISFNNGKPTMQLDHEGIHPAADCK